MIVRSSRAGGFIRVNRRFSTELGYQACELKDRDPLALVAEEDRDRFQEAIERGEGATSARHRTADGDWVEFDWKVRTKNGQTSLFGIRHRADLPAPEVDVQDSPQAGAGMKEILKEMALIIEEERPGFKCSVLLLDDEGLRVSVGAGPSLPEEYNQAVEGLMIGPDVGSCGTAAYWNERVIVEDIQNDILWKDLKEHAAKAGVASCWSHPITSKSGCVLGATALYNSKPTAPTQQDLDGLAMAARMFGLAIERGYAEQALKASEAERMRREEEMEEQLRQAAKMEALGVVAGGIAHDFNNLLTTVMGSAEIAMETVSEGSEAYEMLHDITAASSRASALCNQMLAYAGQRSISTERFDCNCSIRELGELLKISLSKKATIDFRLSPEPLYLEADKAQLDQVIMNLITNAAEALENEVGQIVVATRIHEVGADELAEFRQPHALNPGRYVRISVSDTGVGMSPETQEKIFDPFFTTKFTGRGLGMAAVSGIMQQHHGAIRIESEPGKGSTFTLLFPPANGVVQDAPSKSQQGSDEEFSSRRVLVVDDEANVRKTLTRFLIRADFKVVEARNGRQAIEVYQAEHDNIDCILLDLSMPDLDGEETYRELQKIRPDVRVVLNSGYAEQDLLDRFGDAPLAGILKKPTPKEVLLETIRNAITE